MTSYKMRFITFANKLHLHLVDEDNKEFVPMQIPVKPVPNTKGFYELDGLDTADFIHLVTHGIRKLEGE